MSTSNENIASQQEQKPKKGIAKILIPIAIILVVIFAAVVVFAAVNPSGKYNEAVALMSEDEYEDAIEIFESLNGYKDSEKKIEKCEEKMLEALYEEAEEALEKGKYEKALELFEECGDYEDAQEMVEQIERMLEGQEPDADAEAENAGVSETPAPEAPAPEETEPVEQEPVRQEGEPAYGGHLSVRLYTQLDSLDSSQVSSLGNFPWVTCVWESPLTRDADGYIAPGVCDFELSEDMLTLKLWVREGACFSNGDPVDIEDVVQSFIRHTDIIPELAENVGNYMQSITIKDDVMTIEFSAVNEKTWEYLASNKPWIAVWPKEMCEKYANDLFINQIDDCIGTGPYKVVGFTDGICITVARNEYYIPYGEGYSGYAAPKMAYLDSITFWRNNDNGSTTIGLLCGDYNMVDIVEPDYVEMAEANGIVSTTDDSSIGVIGWRWYHYDTLHFDGESTFPYLYNCFWEDPENHPSEYAS